MKAAKMHCKSKPKRGVHSKRHEIASIKIHGVVCGDIASQEQVNQQARAKKELNAELRERVGKCEDSLFLRTSRIGRSDYISPSVIRVLDPPKDFEVPLFSRARKEKREKDKRREEEGARDLFSS